jgi:hypothetical protein
MMTQNVNNEFYGHIGLEMKRFMHELSVKPTDFYKLIHLFCARVSSRLAYGTDERAVEHVSNAGVFISQLGPSGPVSNLIPFFRHFPKCIVPGQYGVQMRQEKEAELWEDLFQRSRRIQRHKKVTQSYVSSSLLLKELGSKTELLFANEAEAKCAVGMLCTVAIFTLGGPAVLFVMAMILHPEWQEQVRVQLEEVVGGDDLVNLEHSPQLPILRAAIKECLRWKSTVPLGEQ